MKVRIYKTGVCEKCPYKYDLICVITCNNFKICVFAVLMSMSCQGVLLCLSVDSYIDRNLLVSKHNCNSSLYLYSHSTLVIRINKWSQSANVVNMCYKYITYRVGQKSKPDNFCNDFVYCHPIFVIFGTYTIQEICNQKMYSQPT